MAQAFCLFVRDDDQPASRLLGYADWRMSPARHSREIGTSKIVVKDKSMRGVTLFTTSVALAVPAILWPPRPARAVDLVQPSVPQFAICSSASTGNR